MGGRGGGGAHGGGCEQMSIVRLLVVVNNPPRERWVAGKFGKYQPFLNGRCVQSQCVETLQRGGYHVGAQLQVGRNRT